MTRLAVISDLHLDAGAHLGRPDATWGSTRIVDAHRILNGIIDDVIGKVDGLIFAGDLARTAEPGPVPYRVAQEAFSRFDGPIWMVLGNHDYLSVGERNLDVVAAACGARVFDRPGVDGVGDFGGVSLAFLPWSPPIRLFDKAPHRPHSWNAIVGERLHDLIRGLAEQLSSDPRPKVLIGHWLVAGEKLASGRDVVEAHEPLIDAEVIERAGFDLAVFGHNHVHAQVSEKVWSVGPPMRGSFGEAGFPVGYMVIDNHDDSVTAHHVAVEDRQLVTVDVDVDAALSGATPEANSHLAGAVVRIRYACREDQSQPMAAWTRAYIESLKAAGASKVIGPQVTVQRARRERERIDLDVSPQAALERYLGTHEIEGDLRERVLHEAAEIIGEADGGDSDQLSLEPEPW